MFNFNFNSLDITTALAGIAGIGNIITTINNLKQDKYQVENFIYSLKNYRDDIEKYFTEAKKDIELLKNPQQIEADILKKISIVENDYKNTINKLKRKKKYV